MQIILIQQHKILFVYVRVNIKILIIIALTVSFLALERDKNNRTTYRGLQRKANEGTIHQYVEDGM